MLSPILATPRLTGYQGNHKSGLTRAGSQSQDLTLVSQQRLFFLERLFLSRSLKRDFLFNSLHPSVALGTQIFPAPQQDRSLFLASDFMDGCREAVKCSWQINPEQGKRLLFFFLFFLIQLLSDLYHLNNYICPCFHQLWSWLVIAL